MNLIIFFSLLSISTAWADCNSLLQKDFKDNFVITEAQLQEALREAANKDQVGQGAFALAALLARHQARYKPVFKYLANGLLMNHPQYLPKWQRWARWTKNRVKDIPWTVLPSILRVFTSQMKFKLYYKRKYARAINDLNIDELATRYNIDPTFITKIIQSFPSSYELDYIEGRKTSREFLTPVAMLMFAGVFGYYPLQEISEAYALQYPLVQFLEDSEKAMQIDIRQSRVAVAYSTRLFNDYDNVADLAQYIPSLNKFREQSKDYNFAKVSNPVALAQFIEKNKDVDLLIIMAHGEQDNFMLSPGQELIDVNLSQLSPLKPGANLIYISCALGKNAESRDLTKTNWINLAEVILPDGIAIASNQIISLGEVVPASTFQAVSNAYEKYTRNILMNPAGSALGIAQIQTAIEMWPLLNPFFNSEITELKVYHTGTNQLISIPISNTESSDETTSALND